MSTEKRYPKGHFVGIGIAIGIPLGIPIGIALGNIALGPAMGLPIGVAIGFALEHANNKNPIELSEEEMQKRRKLAWGGVIIGLIALATFLVVYSQLK